MQLFQVRQVRHDGRQRVDWPSRWPSPSSTFLWIALVLAAAGAIAVLVHKIAASSAADQPVLRSASATLPALPDLTVLVVDDQEFTREVVAAILRRTGAVVHTASSVREGLQLFRKLEPHVVVCDIAMPEEDGYVFLRQVRARPDALRTTPILALTAFGRPEDRVHALNAGFDGYLKKPVDPAELAESVQRLSMRA
jgi:CheY-like chemotaxis protein